jgi:hypothetical protein
MRTAAVLLLCLAAACGLAAAEGSAPGNTTARLRFSNPLTVGAPANAADAGPGTPLAGLRGSMLPRQQQQQRLGKPTYPLLPT